MNLQSLVLQNFRSYKKAAFDLNPNVTYIIGENTAGKSNLIEAMAYLSSGKSFRAEKEQQVIHFGAVTTSTSRCRWAAACGSTG